MIVTEYMENGALDKYLKVSHMPVSNITFVATALASTFYNRRLQNAHYLGRVMEENYVLQCKTLAVNVKSSVYIY